MRLRTLPLAIVGIGFGLFAVSNIKEIDWLVGGLTLATAMLLQIFSNIANDYGDYKNGADDHREDRASASGTISLKGMKTLLWAFGILSFGTGLSLLFVAFPENIFLLLMFLGLGIFSLLGAYKYTAGKKPYGYAGLGDLSVFIFFGSIGVLGTYFLQIKAFHTPPILLALAVGFLSVSVLNINNIRDLETDAAAGKKTLALKLGWANALNYQKMLYSLALGLLAYYSFLLGPHATWDSKPKLLCLLAFYLIFFFLQKKLRSTSEHKTYTNLLKISVLLILSMSVIYWFI